MNRFSVVSLLSIAAMTPPVQAAAWDDGLATVVCRNIVETAMGLKEISMGVPKMETSAHPYIMKSGGKKYVIELTHVKCSLEDGFDAKGDTQIDAYLLGGMIQAFRVESSYRRYAVLVGQSNLDKNGLLDNLDNVRRDAILKESDIDMPISNGLDEPIGLQLSLADANGIMTSIGSVFLCREMTSLATAPQENYCKPLE